MIGFSLSDEQEQLIATARTFTRKAVTPAAAELDEAGAFPQAICEQAHGIGLMNCEIPQSQGGLELSCLDHCLILEEIAYGCTGVNTTLAGNSLAATPLILEGTEAQKARYLGRLINEPVYAAYCCSEPDAGSDVAGIQTKYEKIPASHMTSPKPAPDSSQAPEKAGDATCYRLTGQKRWITNGGVADFYIVFAREAGTRRHDGISCFVVDRNTPGVSVGKKENKLGQRCSNTTDVLFDGVELGPENLVGQEGAGFKLALRTFDRTRPWVAAGAAGVIRRALDESKAYALERKTFGTPIAQHQAIQFMLADMAISYEATRLLYMKAAQQVDEGTRDSVVSSYAKAFGADAAMKAATDAVQIFGGYGYTKEYPVEKLMRDAKLLQIYEGTSQIQRVVIARNILTKTPQA